ncbi:MAG: ABC transporter permease [Trueperaceae bacterium]|nr:ABC transporter permease [Trueperaceae bacterium]
MVLTLLQTALAAFIVTVALHALEAEQRRIAEQQFFKVTAGVYFGQTGRLTPAFSQAFVRDLLGMAPDVEKAAVYMPGGDRPRVEADGQRFVLSEFARVDATFFDVVGATITRGTPFEPGQTRIAYGGMLLEDEVADLMFMGADPIGRQVTLQWDDGRPLVIDNMPATHRVVGTYSYPDSLATMLRLPRAVGALPIPFNGSHFIYAVPRPGKAQAAKDQLVAGANQLYTGDRVGTEFRIAELDRPYRYFNGVDPQILLFSLFGITALVLVGVGVFSVTVVDVSEQTHQIGVRRVLGASRRRITGEYAATAGFYAFVAGSIGAVAALVIVPTVQRNLTGLLPGAVLTASPILAVATVLVIMALSAGLAVVPALSAGLERPAVALRER